MGNFNFSCCANDPKVRQPIIITSKDIENVLFSNNSIFKERRPSNKSASHSEGSTPRKSVKNQDFKTYSKDQQETNQNQTKTKKETKSQSLIFNTKHNDSNSNTMKMPSLLNILTPEIKTPFSFSKSNSLISLKELVKSTIGCEERKKLPPIQFENGSIYIGEWKNGLRDGFGVHSWLDGSRYEGEWLKDVANGKGKLIHADGDIYEGDWVNDKAEGKGIYIFANGSLYRGDWKEDKQDGSGSEIWPDGAKYQGDYKLGKKEGQGILYFSDGSWYQGSFINNEIEGYGTHNFKNKKYEGLWVKSKMCGKGKFIYDDDKIYEGEMFDDQRNGFGKLTLADGTQFIGEWKKGKQNGIGMIVFNDGNSKYGKWENGKKIEWNDEYEKDKMFLDFIKKTKEFNFKVVDSPKSAKLK